MELRRIVAWSASLLFFASAAHAQMSETERKAAARAAYQEGVQLQDQGKAGEALGRFEAAQKLFDAPTHQLHIAETQALTGKLVEASETYETLIRRPLGANPPDAFVQAQQQAQAEVVPLRARIPTLRVTVKPEPAQLQNLQVSVNGAPMPNELLGIARPVNPGTYRLTATASGYATPAPVEMTVKEKDAQATELVLRAGAPPVVVAAPVPPPYTAGAAGQGPPPPGGAPAESAPAKPKPPGPTSSGLLFGVRGGVFVPGGSLEQGQRLGDFASAGGGFGLDVAARLARILLMGGTFEWASLGRPDNLGGSAPTGATIEATTTTTYLGLLVGIVPNIDKVSFIGDLGLGYRTLSQSRTITLPVGLPTGTTVAGTSQDSYSGVELALGAGVSIPAGPIRIVPKAAVNFGSFSNRECGTPTTTCVATGNISDGAGHTIFYVGVAAYYSLNFGKKP